MLKVINQNGAGAIPMPLVGGGPEPEEVLGTQDLVAPGEGRQRAVAVLFTKGLDDAGEYGLDFITHQPRTTRRVYQSTEAGERQSRVSGASLENLLPRASLQLSGRGC